MTMCENSLLIEFLCEELPPLDLETNIATPFAQSVFSQLQKFTNEKSQVVSFVTPRRFGCIIHGINYEQADQNITRKGPSIASSLNKQEPSLALLGFAKSCAATIAELTQGDDGYYYFTSTVKGKNLSLVIQDVINNALKKIYIAKTMRWGDLDYQFVRPLHNLVVMFNHNVLSCEIFGLKVNDSTIGHRFMTKEAIKIINACEYLQQLEQQGKVLAQFSARHSLIAKQLHSKAHDLGLKIAPSEDLLNEVCALVEWPEVLNGSFSNNFLAIPQECLILSMAKNQKYFALLDKDDKLSNQFLFVSNLTSQAPEVVIEGNQKVLSARLADAEFFYQVDKQHNFTDNVLKLKNVVYHNKLGSQYERITRIVNIAKQIAPQLHVEPQLAERCAYLLKADLVSEMVGEFPELQGIMGQYYALANGESQEVATAINEHYFPRFSGDKLPQNPLSKLMALADKLETLVGIWGIGLIPSGDKDPYALRRAALGVIRLALATNIDLKELLIISVTCFNDKKLNANTAEEVYQFIFQRLANYLSTNYNYPNKLVSAALATQALEYATSGAKRIDYLPSWLIQLQAFVNNHHHQTFFQANKRIENILKKNPIVHTKIKPELFIEPIEQQLYALFMAELSDTHIQQFKQQQNWTAYLVALVKFSQPLEEFFANVMVMTEDLALRNNRLNLLTKLATAFNALANLAQLA